MCPSTNGRAETLFSNIDCKLSELLDLPNPWGMCTALGVDNTAVNIGVHNSIIMLMAAHAILSTMLPRKVGKGIVRLQSLILKNF